MVDDLDIKYQIRSLDHNEHAVVVKYWVEGYEDVIGDRATFNINIFKHPSTWEEIKERIEQCAPVEWFRLLIADTDLNHIAGKVGFIHSFVHKVPEPPKIPTPEEIEEMLKKL